MTTPCPTCRGTGEAAFALTDEAIDPHTGQRRPTTLHTSEADDLARPRVMAGRCPLCSGTGRSPEEEKDG